MKMIKMDTPQCLLYSSAMVLDCEPSDLVTEIGHDGMEVCWPELEKPFCFRSFHPQEIMDCFVRRGYGFLVIDRKSFLGPDGVAPKEVVLDPNRIHAYMKNPGILVGCTKNGLPHAVAWDGKIIYDPNGYNYSREHFDITEFWCQVKLGAMP